VEQFLLDLTERDDFALCLFHSSTRWFSGKPRRAESKAVDKAVQFLLAHKDSGGTELGVALEQALHLKGSTDDRARHVVIVTDAQVTDAGRILRLADEEAERDHRRRISVLCIDAAPNSFLASELAERGGGIARFLTSAPDELDITTALDDVLKDWAEPVLADLQLEVDRPSADAAGRQVVEGDKEGKSFIDLGDLPHGRTVWMAGRAPRNRRKELSFRMTSASHEEVGSCQLDLGKETSDQPALKALFGARRILGLEHLITSLYELDQTKEQLERLGYGPAEVLPSEAAKPSKVYAENVREDARKALRGLLVKEALGYGLASAETAFVAVRKEKGKPVEGTVPVASALPTGWSDDFLSSRAFRAAVGTLRTDLVLLRLTLASPPLGIPPSLSPCSLEFRRSGKAKRSFSIPCGSRMRRDSPRRLSSASWCSPSLMARPITRTLTPISVCASMWATCPLPGQRSGLPTSCGGEARGR
jgi:Ca-activated chloride channel family protein